MQLGGKVVEDVFVLIILHVSTFTASTYYFHNQKNVITKRNYVLQHK